ncbi:ATP-dependent 6-phosphofructokinase [Pygmaiobacter massiliensis]|uniref:6-phosphofructokinase n=1 Tax=Pygmaiobacter massiliensis TaxID=1917873 RepID=UPI002A80879E|nr:ATP-dependent 6-phosphofructokinase [Pygmaiobacter massiliensis]MDY4784002.1 ATP-dependent 6-phosphofructokinase [Pygmaiobacter massiliensis]
MKNGVKRIGIMTGGGDCPGLNAVIRAVVMMADKYGVEVIGIPYGYRGMLLGGDYFHKLTCEDVQGIIEKGGTILHSSNKDNLFKYPRRNKEGFEHDENGKLIYDNFSETAVQNLRDAGIDAMIIVGGDGTLTSGRDYSRMGVPVVGVPKTIDNDLRSTEITFGFDTAVSRCVQAVESVRTTGEAHSRVMFIEVMGRNAGHIALHTAISSGADVVLIPEIPYHFDKLVAELRRRLERNGTAIVIVSEGVTPPEKGAYSTKIVEGSPDAVRFGGVSGVIADYVERALNADRDENGYAISEVLMDVECRATNVGYAQRGGVPTANDRLLSTRFGAFAVKELLENLVLDEKGNFGRMVSVQENRLTSVSLEEVIASSTMIGNQRRVDPEGELVQLARNVQISFADE